MLRSSWEKACGGVLVILFLLLLWGWQLSLPSKLAQQRACSARPKISSTQAWTLIACISCRMEAHNLREWIVWNHLAGIEHFVIFNNNDIAPTGQHDNVTGALQFFIERGLVTIIPGHKDAMNNPQLADEYGLQSPFGKRFFETLNMKIGNPLKHRCWEMYKYRAKWIAFIDNDEYFTPIKPYATLPEMLLNRFNTKAGVGFFWKIASYTGHFLRPADGSVSHYKLCKWHPSNRHIKTIAQPQLINGVDNAHYLGYPTPNAGCVTDDGTSTGCDVSNLWKEDWFPVYQEFSLNHYFSRSVEEFLRKSLRGIHYNKDGDYLRKDMPGHSDCELVDDGPTNHMIGRVKAQMAAWNLTQWPLEDMSAQVLSSEIKDDFLRQLVEAVQQRKSWNETFYMHENRNKQECLPPGFRDGFIHYWLSNTPKACTIKGRPEV